MENNFFKIIFLSNLYNLCSVDLCELEAKYASVCAKKMELEQSFLIISLLAQETEAKTKKISQEVKKMLNILTEVENELNERRKQGTKEEDLLQLKKEIDLRRVNLENNNSKLGALIALSLKLSAIENKAANEAREEQKKQVQLLAEIELRKNTNA